MDATLQSKEIQELKDRIDELKDVIKQHAVILDNTKGIYSPYLDRDVEEMQHLRKRVFARK